MGFFHDARMKVYFLASRFQIRSLPLTPLALPTSIFSMRMHFQWARLLRLHPFWSCWFVHEIDPLASERIHGRTFVWQISLSWTRDGHPGEIAAAPTSRVYVQVTTEHNAHGPERRTMASDGQGYQCRGRNCPHAVTWQTATGWTQGAWLYSSTETGGTVQLFVYTMKGNLVDYLCH